MQRETKRALACAEDLDIFTLRAVVRQVEMRLNAHAYVNEDIVSFDGQPCEALNELRDYLIKLIRDAEKGLDEYFEKMDKGGLEHATE